MLSPKPRPLDVPSASKPILRVLRGERVSPPPIWLMRQAGRYLPEYRELSQGSGGFVDRCTTPDLATEITLQPVRRFGMDAAILFSDILIVPWALGQGLDFVGGEGPVLPPVRDAAALDALSTARLQERTAPVMETVRRVRAALPAECALIGFAGSPFTVACYMVEGGGSRDFAVTRCLAWREPALFGRLLDLLHEATLAYLSAQVAAGAEALMLFDSWAGILPPSEFARHVTARTAALARELRARHPDVPLIGFPRLAGGLVGAYAEATGVDGVGLDTGMDPRQADALLPPGVAAQGNLDPIALIAGGEALAAEARGVLAGFASRPHIFNLGHGILPQTPPDHVAELVALVRGRA